MYVCVYVYVCVHACASVSEEYIDVRDHSSLSHLFASTYRG